LFEKAGYTGGRFEHAVKALSPNIHSEFLSLVDELNLSDSLTSLDNMGVLTEKGIKNFKGFSSLVDNLPEVDQNMYEEMEREVKENNFDIFNPSDHLLNLRDMRFSTYLGEKSDLFMRMIVGPLLDLTFMNPVDASRVSAEYGLFKLKFLLEITSEDALTFGKDEGIKVVTNVLERKARDLGVNFKLSTEVKRVEFDNENVVTYQKIGKEKQKSFDQIVFAMPLSQVNKISPLSVGQGLFYEPSKYYSLEGDLKSDKDIIFSKDKSANARLFFNVYHKEQQVFPINKEEKVDFDRFYDDYMLLEQTEEANPFPSISSGAEVPDLKQREGIYLCGDFYYYPCIETAVKTAQEVTKMITSS
ncbi:MAG: FAD-dependent oxidoreductase, partial [Patescibacteria group bacterium]